MMLKQSRFFKYWSLFDMWIDEVEAGIEEVYERNSLVCCFRYVDFMRSLITSCKD